MGIILFLVDTSASMNQKTYLGTSYLDVAKVAIETFTKYHTRDPSSRGDRYMLVSYDELNPVKAGWKENHAAFVSELKNLQATSLSTFGHSLKEAFDLLNIHRLHTGIDHYGQGRNPFYLEPAVVIALTDGGKLINSSTVEQELSFPMDTSCSEGSELTNLPYRWDQRLFSVILRLPGIGDRLAGNGGGAPNDYVISDNSIYSMCEATGGKCYVVSNQKSLVQCMESLTQKLHPGVVLNFQRIGGPNGLNATGGQDSVLPMEVENDQAYNGNNNSNGHLLGGREKDTPPPVGQDRSTAWCNTRKMIFVKVNPKTNVPSGFWPIPEAFWPDHSTTSLPPRDVHPVVMFDTTDQPPMLVESFPFDKYELEPSPLTQYILSRRNTNVCWQVYINNSGKQNGLSYSFGYLKASSNFTHVNLFVMPFNYPTLLPLIDELLKHHRMRPPPVWRQKFSDYLSTVPLYYATPLRNALRLMGAPASIMPDSFEGQISYSVSNYLRKLKKQAKIESDRVVGLISKNRVLENSKRGNGIVDLGEGISLAIGSPQVNEGITSQSFRNPFDISRSGLLGQLARMRTNFLHATPTTPNFIEEVIRHQVPINQMGNYQEHLKRINPLRELDSGAVRTQLFGNPFKLERPADNKKVDNEMDIFADEHMVEMNRRTRSSGRRRSRLRSLSPKPSPPPQSHPNTPTPSQTSTTPRNAETPPNTRNDTTPSDNNNPNSISSDKIPIPKDAHQQIVSKSEEITSLTSSPITTTTPSQPEPFKSSSLPEERLLNNTTMTNSAPTVTSAGRTPLEKVQKKSLSRKRERTPSPTPQLPNSKRQASAVSTPLGVTTMTSGAENPSKLTSNSTSSLASIGRSTPTMVSTKSPSPVPMSLGGGVGGAGSGPRLNSVSFASKLLTEEIQKQQGQENSRIKGLIVKEVRKQGKQYDVIFHHLETVRGSIEVRKAFVNDIIREAAKFKKKKLVQQLEEWQANLIRLKVASSGGPGDSRDLLNNSTSLGKSRHVPLKR